MAHSTRRYWALAVASGLAVAAGWWLLRSEPFRYPGANVLLVTIDTLRADRLGSYGYSDIETPRMDAVAVEGIRFEEAVAPVPLTLPSHTSLMSSLYPPRHGVRDNGAFEIAPDAVLLAEVLREAGYETAAFVGAYVLHSRFGLARGFDTYDDEFDYGSPSTVPGQVERRGDAVLEVAVPWLRSERAVPFFGWVHLYDPHAPYDPPEPYRSRYTGRAYDGEVAYSDSLVGELLDALAETGELERTVVIVTGDHGEGLGDHGEPGHGLFIYDTTLLVPLLIRLPGRQAAGTTVSEQVRTIDIAPTVLDLLGVAAPDSYAGTSLLELVRGEGAARPAYAETLFPRLHFGWQDLYALRSEGAKYILAPRSELYDLATDPGEQQDLSAIQPERAAALRAELEERRGDAPASGPERMSAEALRRLRALGYIGSAPAELPDGELPDPKDKLELFRRLTDAQGLLQSGQPNRAEQVLEQVVAEDTRIVDAWFTLGNARFAQDEYARAIEAFEATLELDPDYDLALSNLALTRRRLGDVAGARADLEALQALVPDSTSAAFHLGELDLEGGDPESALAQFERGLESNDSMPGLHFGAGVAALQLGDVIRAKSALEYTAELAPSYPEVHYYLAQVAEREGDPEAAAAAYRAEIDNDPNHYRSWFNLSQLLVDSGDHPGAVEALQRVVDVRPDFAVGYLYLSRSLLALEDPQRYEEAADAARRGLELGPPADMVPLGHLVLADVYNRLGDTEAAQRELARARAAQQRAATIRRP